MFAALLPSVIGAGASMYGASKAAKASKKAAEQALALQREQYQQARTDMQPYMQAVIETVTFGASASLLWWFGERATHPRGRK